MTKTVFRPLAAAALAISGAALVAVAVPALAQQLPDGNGKELVATICASCHDLSPVTEGGFSKDDWELVIKSMREMGADIKPDQATILVNYLATNFPPKPKQ
jgi:mono/diheme cytochrome c family protein